MPRQNGDGRDDHRPEHPAHRVPIAQVDTPGAATRDSRHEVVCGHNQRGGKEQTDRPRPLAVFLVTGVVTEIQSQGTEQRCQVEQRKPEPGKMGLYKRVRLLRAAT